MIIKRWNGSAFVEEYAKTKGSLLYANDGTTALFDANLKLKPEYLPNAVFDSLYYFGSVGANANLRDLIADAIVSAAASGNPRTAIGYYYVASAAITLTGNSTSTVSTTQPLLYLITSFIPGDGGSTEVYSETLEAGDWFIINSISGTGASGTPYVAKVAVVNNTYESASATTQGIVKLFSNTSQSVAANAVSATANRTYGIQNNGSGQLVVNVPWTDTTYSQATNSALGLVKLGLAAADQTLQAATTTASRFYRIGSQLDGTMYVNVPWTDTTYSAATINTLGLAKLSFSSQQSAAGVQAETTTGGRTYGIQEDTNGRLVVNVPWTDTNTTYAMMTSSVLGLGKLGSDTTQTIAANAVTATASRSYAIQKNGSDQLVVNVPWTDTTYSMMSSSTLGLGKLFSDTEQSVAANAVSATASRSYGIQRNASNQLVVNVPWTDTTYSAGEGVTFNGTVIRETFPLYVQTATPTTTVNGAIWFDIN